MTLSNQSIVKMSEALASEIASELMETDEWYEFLLNNIQEILEEKIGKIEPALLAELTMGIADNLKVIPWGHLYNRP
jgi:hypothetical protein